MPPGETPEQVLCELEAVEQQQSSLDGQRLRLLAEYRAVRAQDGEYGLRSAPVEIGLALRVEANYAADQLEFAHAVIERLPDTVAALFEGRIDRTNARALFDITRPLSVDLARAVEAKVLPTAGGRTVSQLRSSARYQRDKVDPEQAELRRQRTQEERRVSFEPLQDGAAELSLEGPGERVLLAWLFTDPVSGLVKDLDRKSYRPPESLAEFIQVRDGTRIAPGCTKPAHLCQVDHTIKWAALSWPDHRLKEVTGWTLEQPKPGQYSWTSPIGQRYDRMPEALIPLWPASRGRPTHCTVVDRARPRNTARRSCPQPCPGTPGPTPPNR